MINNCKYCNTPYGGDIPDDHKFLIDFEEFERNGEITVSINGQESIFHNDAPYTLWVDIMNAKLIACVNEESYDAEGYRAIENENSRSIDINFCPICGRKLPKR